jgi:DnaJ-class molecular chaperone
MTSHYETLGVPPGASKETIKKAYHRARAKAHPDREGGDHSKMQLVQRAWETLSDQQKRERYDHTGEDGSGSEPSIEQKAQQAFSQFLDDWLESDQFHEPLKLFTSKIIDVKRKIDSALTTARRSLVKIEKRAKVLRRKSKGSDIFKFCVEQKLRAVRTEIATLEREKQVAEGVTELLKDYELGVGEKELEEMLERGK